MKRFLPYLKLLVSVSLIGFLVYKLQESNWPSIISMLDWKTYSLLVLGYLLTQVFSTWRWKVLCDSVGFKDRFNPMFADYMVGSFYNLFLPTSVGGDIGRAYRIAKRQGQHYLTAVLTTIAERMAGFAVIIAAGLLGLLVTRPEHWVGIALVSISILCVAMLGLYGFTLSEKLPVLGPILQKKILKIQAESPSHQIETEHLRLGIWATKTAVNASLAISLIVQTINILLQVALLHMLGLGHLSVWLVASIYSVTSVISMVPLSLSGIGLREGSTVALLISWGHAPANVATTFSLAWLGLILLSSIPGACITLYESIQSKTSALKRAHTTFELKG